MSAVATSGWRRGSPRVHTDPKCRREIGCSASEPWAKFPDAALADLYDATAMKPELRKVHRALDVAVDRLYRRAAFSSDRERVEHLFGLYEATIAPLTALKPRRKKRT